MMMTFLAIVILLATTLLVLGNLRMVAQDTFQAIQIATQRARQSHDRWSRLAFAALWVLIFALSYW